MLLLPCRARSRHVLRKCHDGAGKVLPASSAADDAYNVCGSDSGSAGPRWASRAHAAPGVAPLRQQQHVASGAACSTMKQQLRQQQRLK